MSAPTFCLYNHHNKSILCLLVLNPADSSCITYKAFFCALCVCVFLGGYCSDHNQLKLTVLSSGVRLYISPVLSSIMTHNGRHYQRNTVTWWGEGRRSLRRFALLFLPFTTSEGVRGSLELSEEVRAEFPRELQMLVIKSV